MQNDREEVSSRPKPSNLLPVIGFVFWVAVMVVLGQSPKLSILVPFAGFMLVLTMILCGEQEDPANPEASQILDSGDASMFDDCSGDFGDGCDSGGDCDGGGSD